MAPCNTNIDLFSCTLQTCCREQGLVQYEPQLAATLAYLIIFAVFFVVQSGLGIYFKTWGFFIGMSCGLVLEILGYAGRMMIRSNPFNMSIFLLYFIPLGLGPAFITGAIYLTLGRIVTVYGTTFSRIKPRTYTVAFVCVDFFSLCIQAVGGGISAAAQTDSFRQQGVDILITGLTLQAVSLATFLTLSGEYLLRVRRGDRSLRNPSFEELRAMRRFKYFMPAICVAAILIFIRCVYRVVELAQGFSGEIANDELPFLILEGPMIMFATLFLTLWHPGLVFRGGFWQAANWKLRAPKKGSFADSVDMEESYNRVAASKF